MQAGDVIISKKIRAVIQSGDGWVDYKTNNKDECFLLLLLGTTDIKNPSFDLTKTLNSWGWYFKEDINLKGKE